MKILLLNVFFVLVASVGSAQVDWRLLDDFVAGNSPDIYNYGTMSTLATGIYKVHAAGACRPREHEVVTNVVTDVWIMPAKLSSEKVLVDPNQVVLMPYYEEQVANSNSGININFNYSNFHFPVVQMNRSSCSYELCINNECATRFDRIIDVTGVNLEVSSLKSDLKVEEIQITGDAVVPDGSGGYYFKSEYKAPDPRLPISFKAKVKISGSLTWDEVYGKTVLTLVAMGIKSSSPIFTETFFQVSQPDLYREGEIWSEEIDFFVYENQIPDVYQFKAEVNYYREIDETNYDNNIKIVPLRLPSNDQPKLSVSSVKLAQVVYNPELKEGALFGGWVDLPTNKADKEFFAVADKSASFEVTVGVNGVVPASGTFRVKVKDAGGSILMETVDLSLSELIGGSIVISPDKIAMPTPRAFKTSVGKNSTHLRL